MGTRSALHGVYKHGRAGQSEGDPGVVLAERTGLHAFVLLAHKGQADSLREALKRLGHDLPTTPRRSDAQNLALIWTGPGQWLGLTEARNAGPVQKLFAPLDTLCSIVRADDSRIILSVGGPRARATLAKMLQVDLHPRAFRPGDVAVTPAGIIPAILWQVDAAPTYDIAVPRSFAQSFWHWLTDSGAEFGTLVTGDVPA